VVTLAISIVNMLLVGRNLLSRERYEKTEDQPPSALDVISSYGLTDRWHLLHMPQESTLVGQTVAAERQPLHERYGLDLLGFEKHKQGRTRYLTVSAETVFEPNDVVFTLLDDHQVDALSNALGCEVTGPREERQRQEVLQDIGVAEVMPAPESKSIGRRLGDLDLPSNYDVTVLAIRHRGQPISENLASQTLDLGDTLLVEGSWDDITRLSDGRQDFVLLDLPAEYQQRLAAPGRACASHHRHSR
jgi:K+/H+ antiporter YhaU regulatory subunit KhtT